MLVVRACLFDLRVFLSFRQTDDAGHFSATMPRCSAWLPSTKSLIIFEKIRQKSREAHMHSSSCSCAALDHSDDSTRAPQTLFLLDMAHIKYAMFSPYMWTLGAHHA